MLNNIVIRGARVHNLKNISLTIPRDSLVVITGPSGSGKSSLAFDTIYAEGQRRYVESLSAYARQFLEQLQKPDADAIEGLSPSIAIEQKTTSRSRRSTVGTITEVYDYLRVAFTRIGRLLCYQCGSPIATQKIQSIVDAIAALPEGTKMQVLSPLVSGRKGLYKKELYEARRKGIIRARIDGRMHDITGDIELNRHKRHDIDIVIDRLIIQSGIEKHISRAVTAALEFSDIIILNIIDDSRDLFFSTRLACPKCGINYPEVSPRFFSFNSPYGACPECGGLGVAHNPDDSRESSLDSVCLSCNGMRLRKEALAVKIGGLNIGEISSMPVKDIIKFLEGLELGRMEQIIVKKVFRETRERLSFLMNAGLGYLTLDRPANTLSSGEAQRIRLAAQIGSSLAGVLYIFDEPTIGLHPRDCGRLIDSLHQLRDMGNTVLVVEHDEDTMLCSDHIVDMGPGAGEEGGYIVASGTVQDIIRDSASLTGAYLGGKMCIPVPEKRRQTRSFLGIRGASAFNLKDIDVRIPLGLLTCVTGVSGSGKSTLIIEILYKAIAAKLYSSRGVPGRHRGISGIGKIDKIIDIDQAPLGRTPRSNPATYTGIFTLVRNLFARLPESRVRGYGPGRFSFNITGGRCEACRGDGLIRVSMHFLPDVYIPCESCRGSRYRKETLDIKYKGMSIADVLDMTVRKALVFFDAIPALKRLLSTLEQVGLGYIRLGQSATTLSGGEAQRIKLAKELSRRATGRTLYILDEPTTGLHYTDIQRLLDVINRLVDAGNTVVIIEHNLDVIKSADYIIDLGPESGADGGRVVASGTPEQIALTPESQTGRYLKDKLKGPEIRDRDPK